MKQSIKLELLNHIIDTVNSMDDDGYYEELHHLAFNTDYYITGYYNAEQWLTNHDLTAWEVISEVQEYEMDNFGETNTKMNSEAMVNMYVYIIGEELISNLDLTLTRKELLNQLDEIIKA